ncbi:MAG: MATE family efflux transporter [Acetobacteraceae bacterium]
MAQATVDVILAGHLDPLVLSAVSLGASLWSFAYLGAVGLSLALPSLVSHLNGAGRRGEVGALFRQAAYLALVVGLVLMMAVRLGGPLVVGALGFEPRLAASIIGFLRAVSPGAPALTLYLACRGLSDGLGMPRAGMAVSLFGLAVLAPLPTR